MNKIISFGLCPFVQRSLITMNHKKVPYDVEYIDLANKPDWFLKISPLGKVPVLEVKDRDVVLFESAVINEYIDETSEGSLLPLDPLLRAKDRAYIELSSAAIMSYFQAAIAQDEESYIAKKVELEKNLSSLLAQYQGPFYNGNSLSLVDTGAIPLIQRMIITKNLMEDLNLSKENNQKLNSWLEATLHLDEVKKSVPENFEADFQEYLATTRNSYIHNKA